MSKHLELRDVSVSFNGLKESTPTVLRIFKEVLTEPEFRRLLGYPPHHAPGARDDRGGQFFRP